MGTKTQQTPHVLCQGPTAQIHLQGGGAKSQFINPNRARCDLRRIFNRIENSDRGIDSPPNKDPKDNHYDVAFNGKFGIVGTEDNATMVIWESTN
eukprot:scaffold10364_cov61-Attheya_sp.AAC.7